PEQRRRVEEELDALLAGSSGPLSVEAARNLHVLDLFIREAGRLHSPVQTVPRGVVQEVEFAGYTLPPGTPVRLSLAACHRMPQYFENPDAFDPDRFAPPREEDRKTPYALVTFGGGPRLCIGVNFANIEVKALAADVLRRYELAPAESEPPFEVGFITLMMPQGIAMRVLARTDRSADCMARAAGGGRPSRSSSGRHAVKGHPRPTRKCASQSNWATQQRSNTPPGASSSIPSTAGTRARASSSVISSSA